MMSYLHLMPAYGRDYASQKALLMDFYGNKDFVRSSGPHQAMVSASELPAGTRIQFRFGRNLKTFCHVVTKLSGPASVDQASKEVR